MSFVLQKVYVTYIKNMTNYIKLWKINNSFCKLYKREFNISIIITFVCQTLRKEVINTLEKELNHKFHY